jgi:hypothetical protein
MDFWNGFEKQAVRGWGKIPTATPKVINYKNIWAAEKAKALAQPVKTIDYALMNATARAKNITKPNQAWKKSVE